MSGPALAVRGSTIAVAWYTEAQEQKRVQLAVSRDGGATFAIRRVVASGKGIQGRVGIAFVDDDTVAVSYIEPAVRRGSLVAIKRFPVREGAVSSARSVQVRETGRIDIFKREHGFPQLLGIEGGVLLAWTTVDDTVDVALVRWPE